MGWGGGGGGWGEVGGGGGGGGGGVARGIPLITQLEIRSKSSETRELRLQDEQMKEDARQNKLKSLKDFREKTAKYHNHDKHQEFSGRARDHDLFDRFY